MHNFQNYTFERASLLENLNKKKVHVSSSKKKIWKFDECVRLLAGRMHYEQIMQHSNGVWKYLAESSLYGFFFTRNRQQMRDANVRISKMSVAQRNLLTQAANSWKPECFTIELHLDEFRHFGHKLDLISIDLYTRLHKLDLDAYNLDLIDRDTVPLNNQETTESTTAIEDLIQKLIVLEDRVNTLESTLLKSSLQFLTHETLDREATCNNEMVSEILDFDTECCETIHESECDEIFDTAFAETVDSAFTCRVPVNESPVCSYNSINGKEEENNSKSMIEKKKTIQFNQW